MFGAFLPANLNGGHYTNSFKLRGALASKTNQFSVPARRKCAPRYTVSLSDWLGGCAKGYFFIESVEVI